MTLRLLTLEEVAGVLGCSARTVRRRVDAGTLSVFRDGRILRVSESALAGYVQARTAAPVVRSSPVMPLPRRAPAVVFSLSRKLTAQPDPLADARAEAGDNRARGA